MNSFKRLSHRLGVATLLLLAMLAWHAEAIAAPLTLTWVDNSVDEAGFSVERSTGGAGAFAEIATTGPQATTYVDSSVTDGTSYCYRVRAFNPNGYSDYSNTACSGSPSDITPPTVSITAPTGGTVSGNVTIMASATDNVGVTMIKYYVDGALIGIFAPPVYSLVWNTALVPNGTHTLTVKATDAAGNTGTSAAVTVTVANPSPVPVLSSILPSSALQGGPAFTLTVTGSGFVSVSTVRWNGSSRTTTFVSATQLTAAIPASDLAAAGTAQVTVFTPTPGGGTSSARPFTVTAGNPVPVLSTLAPSSALQGGPAFTLTVTGSGFVSASTVQWNGGNRTTTFVSATQLTAAIPASDLVAAGTAQVTVFTPAPGGIGGSTSNALPFAITTVNPVPTLSTLAPSSALQGGPAFTLTVTGSGFVSTSTVRWNGGNRPTTFVSATQLTAAIPASDLVAVGTAQVTVFTPAPGGGTSSAVAFTITALNPVPVLSTLAPSSALQGGPAFTLTVTGANFVPASVVQWNGGNRTTTFVSATQLTAAIPASDLVTAGTAQVTVFTPAPGGGTSSALSFTVTADNPVPTLSSLAPSSALQGGPAFTLTVTGSGFVPASIVQWNGGSRTTTFVSATQLTATILAADLASARTPASPS